MQSPAEQYIHDVLAGRIITSQWVRLCCQRHIDDLEHGHKRGLRFNRRKAERVVEFFDRFVVQTDDVNAGKPLCLLPFQQALLWIFYGWQWAETGFRRYKIGYIELGRGNGKSALLSGLAAMELVTGPLSAEVYSAATDRDSAKIIWETSGQMIELSPALCDRVKVGKKAITVMNRASRFIPLSAQARNLQGKRPSFVVIDELHAHPNRDVWDSMVMALGKRDDSRLVALTTAGHDRHSICWENREYSLKVLQGIIPDDSWFSFIACIDDEDDYLDERCWIKANPALGEMVRLQDMREQCLKAQSDSAALNAFLRYRLNVWTDNAAAYFPMEEWDKCGDPVDPTKLKGLQAFGGLDLSSTTDISAFVLLFPPQGDLKKWAILPHFFLPKENIAKRVKRDRVPYHVWAREGFFTLTPDNVIDTQFIRERIRQLSEDFRIIEIGFDRALSADITPQLESDGLTMVQIHQGEVAMTPPTKKLLELVLRHELATGSHPVLRWMANNFVVRVGATGLLKPDKERSTERIDGISATLDALARALVMPITNHMWTAEVW